jgi:hypothetical protein
MEAEVPRPSVGVIGLACPGVDPPTGTLLDPADGWSCKHETVSICDGKMND